MIVNVRSPKKSNFTSPCGFNVVFIELCNEPLPCLVGIKRREIGQFSWRNYHASRMLTYIASDAFELKGHFNNFLRLFIRINENT